MALPTFVAAGASSGSLAAITPVLPAGIAVNDILLLFVETANQTVTIADQNGGVWAAVPNSPQSYNDADGDTNGNYNVRLTVFWSRYNGTQGSPTTSDSGDHNSGRILAFRGVKTTGNPWNVTSGGAALVSDGNAIIPGAATTVNDCLIVLAVADNADTVSTRYVSFSNAALANIVERADGGTAEGNGGGLGIATGEKAVAGAYGNTIADTSLTSASFAMMSIALEPSTAPVIRPTPSSLLLGVGT